MVGCGNHGCVIAKPKGQGTNGRCHCLDPIGKNGTVIMHKLIEKNYAIKSAIEVLDKNDNKELIKLLKEDLVAEKISIDY